MDFKWNQVLENGLHVYANEVPTVVTGMLLRFGEDVYAIVSPGLVTGIGCSISQNGNEVKITVGGSGSAVAIGEGSTAVTRGGVHIANTGNVHGPIIT